jgi:predicted phage-related endonuclease
VTPADRAAFLAERLTGIGGSDCASLFNVGWGCRRRLWYQKRQTPPDFPRDENDLMALGNILEPFFLDKYARETGRVVRREQEVYRRGPLLVHPEATISDDHVSFGVPLSVKSCGRAAFSKYKREGLPEDYILQLQQEMYVLYDAPWGAFAIGCRDDGRMIHWDVKADLALQQRIGEEATTFWYLLQDRDANMMPHRLSPDDSRCQNCEYRTTCQGSNLVHIEKQGDYDRDESLAELVLERQRAAALAKEAGELFEDATEALKDACGDRTMLLAAGHRIQYYSQDVKEYVVPARTQRPMRVYPPKKERS